MNYKMRMSVLAGALGAALLSTDARARDYYFSLGGGAAVTVHWTEGGRAARARPYALTWLDGGKVRYFSHEELLAADFRFEEDALARDGGRWPYADPRLGSELDRVAQLAGKTEAAPELQARIARLRQTLAVLRARERAAATAKALGGKPAPDLGTLLADAERWINGVARDAAQPFVLEDGKPVGRYWQADRTLAIPQHQLGRAEYLLDEAGR